MTLTPEGEVFAQEVRRIQQDLRHAFASLHDLAMRRAGKVAVAALPSVAAVWMPEVIARYRKANPMLRIELHDALANGGLALLREGKVDMAITAGGDLREFETTVLKKERFYLVCRADHALASRSRVALSQLAGQEMIHLARSSSVRQQLEALASAPSATPNALEVEHLATVAALVAQGLGVSVVPELTLFHFRREGLRAIPVSDAGLRRPILLARRKGEALSVAAQAMAKEIAAQAMKSSRG